MTSRLNLHYLVTVISAIILMANIPILSSIVIVLAWIGPILATMLWLAYKYIPDELNEFLAKAKAKRSEPILPVTHSYILSGITLFALVVSGAYLTAIASTITAYFTYTYFRPWLENGTTETGE